MFQVLDLENDYFFVCFQDDSGYLATISRGSWSIFGYYLMVRSWSPSFSINQSHMNNVMDWIRLLGLSEGMYTKRLLKAIGGVIGPVVKIDQNTNKGTRG